MSAAMAGTPKVSTIADPSTATKCALRLVFIGNIPFVIRTAAARGGTRWRTRNVLGRQLWGTRFKEHLIDVLNRDAIRKRAVNGARFSHTPARSWRQLAAAQERAPSDLC